ncbi:hypothetical protein VOLCADRAFT_119963 [Volvox carteri f. nagariensis]|uniref:EF-hand domain-containing protein n=1 Tax=Volvox carteri f. nagariensis TaxID=3068 RepID=D8UIF5_VOLCA|nr:uncharacterized protein VOLCADRAFT_119963 [Volvox carteri f. nagariensis]EFJ40521.1 hypothetical protein VOLCADRAFT_119963 [Volvox carteri f. nagariensis]|eukprot:XP_002958445.1 hypothetical protein VOLCADRAFT_119963 [Volvox carteri f. nagariensis]
MLIAVLVPTALAPEAAVLTMPGNNDGGGGGEPPYLPVVLITCVRVGGKRFCTGVIMCGGRSGAGAGTGGGGGGGPPGGGGGTGGGGSTAATQPLTVTCFTPGRALSTLPDRRMRPQSAFVPRQSYFKHKGEEDDVGRSVLQHKPLAKGEFTQLSLAKVFDDDPGMRPKVFTPLTVNKISYGLLSRDIDGASSAAKGAPFRARDTDPNTPRYILPGASTPATEAAAAATEAAATAAADGVADAPSTLATPRQQPRAPLQLPQRNTRDTLDVYDINRVDSVSERPEKMETRHTLLSTRDVEGSWPGWEPPFRAHVGKNLRDPGLDVSDISGTRSRRRIFSARPTLGSSSRGGGSATARDPPRPPQELPPPPPEAAAATWGTKQPSDQLQLQPQRCSSLASGGRQQQEQQQPQSYLPPPLTWQPVQYDTGGQQWSSEGSSNGSNGTTRRYSHPVRQQQQQQQSSPLPQQQQQQREEEQFVHAAGAWPTTVTLPLRPSISPPPFATYIPTGSVAAVLSAALDPSTASRTAAVADHPAATVGKPSPAKRDVAARHAAKVTLAEVQRADAAEAHRMICSLLPSREAVEEFYSSCRRLDRESCGKVAPTDFVHALERANLLDALVPGTASAELSAAAAKALTRGFQDGCGMVSYRYLAKALLSQTSMSQTRLSSSSKVTAAPAVLTSASTSALAGPAESPATAVDVRTPQQTLAPAVTSAAGAVRQPVRPSGPFSEVSDGNIRAACPGPAEGVSDGAAAAAADSADGSGEAPCHAAAKATAAAAAAAAASSQAQDQGPPKAGSPPSQPPAAASESYDGMGFGPHWPPEPPTSNLQKRSTAAIMEGSNVQLRDVCDVSYFPYKAHALWFGGRVGSDGAAAAGGPTAAAREYQPSTDPTSFIVGKGHHRGHIPPSGRKLEPEVEAALVVKLRPKSSLGGSPEATARAKTASPVVNQLNEDNPLQYPGRVDPATPAGEALKEMMGPLYSTGRHGGGGGSGSSSSSRGAVRPATAGPRRSWQHSRPASVSRSMSVFSGGGGGGGGGGGAGAGGGGGGAGGGGGGGGGNAAAGAAAVHVGRVALERQIQREELAAVRRLC